MSQERTKPSELDPMFADMPVTTTAGEMHRLMIQIEELKAAQAETDRLNAENADLTAKVQERDSKINDLQGEIRGYTQTITDYHARGDKVIERDKEIERLSWSNGEQVKEIERLRAGIMAAIEKADWAESDDNEFPRLGYLDVKDILRAALKGAE